MTDTDGLNLAALRRARDRLTPAEQRTVTSMARDLSAWLHDRCAYNPAGERACLEILAAIGQALNARERVR